MKLEEIKNIKKVLEERRENSRIAVLPFEQAIGTHDPKYIESLMTRDIPERYLDAFPDKMDQAVKNWVSEMDGSRGIFIYGGVGTGKTFNLYCLARLFRANRMSVSVKNFPDWLDELRSSYDQSNSDQGIKEQFKMDRILILDDLGAEKQTDWTQEIIYRLVNNRYEQLKPTIFSSNLDLEGIAKIYGERVASRIVEMIGGKKGVIKIDGEDRRLEK